MDGVSSTSITACKLATQMYYINYYVISLLFAEGWPFYEMITITFSNLFPPHTLIHKTAYEEGRYILCIIVCIIKRQSIPAEGMYKFKHLTEV